MAQAFCLCFPQRTPTVPKSSRTERQPDIPSVPSAGEYVLEGTKITLDLLTKVASLIPLPYVTLAVEAVSTLISIGEDIHSNAGQCDALNADVCALMLVMIKPLNGKKPEEISADLKKDIEQLTTVLESIIDTLRAIAAQNFFLTFIFKSINTDKIRGCSQRLEVSMKKFDVSRQINDAVRLWKIATDIRKVGDDVNKTLTVVEDVRDTAREGVVVVTKMSSQLDQVHLFLMSQHDNGASPLPLLVMPSKPLIFLGRDSIVEDIARRLFNADSPRIAILGPGGMGKTAVALAVMDNTVVMEKYAKNSFWVPCVEARSPSQFLDLLARSLRITQASNDRLHDIISELETSPQPRVVLLDNFETPWDLENSQSKIEDILKTLAKVPRLALLVTMRSNYPPSDGIKWEQLEWSSLPALDINAARQVYIDIHPDAHPDPALDVLLTDIGFMPLAITLMAKVGKNTGTMPCDLLKSWKNTRVGTDLISIGQDTTTSINKSVQLSINSNHMRANPSAIALLAVLSMLPGGAHRDFLPQLAPSILNITGALATLTESSLVELRPTTRSLHVQPVIRSYVLVHDQPPPPMRRDVYEAFYDFVLAHNSEPGDTQFNDDARALANEETNIQAILMDVAQQGPEAAADRMFDALLSFSRYQRWTRPRTEVIEHAVRVAREVDNKQRLAEGLYCLGGILLRVDQHDAAYAAFMEARAIFQTLGDALYAAWCLIRLGETNRVRRHYDDGCAVLEEAQLECRGLNDARATADGLATLALLYCDIGRHEEAYPMFQKARQDFLDHRCPLDAAHCLKNTAWAHYRGGQYGPADEEAQEALQEYRLLGYPRGAATCVQYLGNIQLHANRLPEAVASFLQAINEWQQLGATYGVANCLSRLGDAYAMQELNNDACAAFEESRRFYQRVNSGLARLNAARCLVALGDNYHTQTRRNEACVAWEEACREFRGLDADDELDECLWKLEVIRSESQPAEDVVDSEGDSVPGIGIDTEKDGQLF